MGGGRFLAVFVSDAFRLGCLLLVIVVVATVTIVYVYSFNHSLTELETKLMDVANLFTPYAIGQRLAPLPARAWMLHAMLQQ